MTKGTVKLRLLCYDYVKLDTTNYFSYLTIMSKYKDVVVTLSKKHPETGETVPAGQTYVIGVLGNKKKWYEINSQLLNGLSTEDLQKELFKILHPQSILR
jgi:hypothetical protein